MSTTGMTSWAVDLKDIGPIHPFQGTEVLLVIIGLVCWIGWHIWCMRWEKRYQEEKIREYGNADNLKKAAEAE